MHLSPLMPGILGLGTALTALLRCQHEAAPATPGPTATITTLAHPGVVNSQASLALVAQQANAGDATRQAGYDKVVDFMNSNALPTSFPAVVYAKASGGTFTENQIRRDCLLAYALRWVKTGDATYAGQAKQVLLNGYANTFQRYDLDVASGTQQRQTYLATAWVTPTFGAAAEIIRYYQAGGQGADWSASDISKFDAIIHNLHDNYGGKLPGASSDVNNWQVSYCYAAVAVGGWLDSPTACNAGYSYLQQHLGDFIRADGNVNEYGRDCHHLHYTLCALTYAAETGRIQGNAAPYDFNNQAIRSGRGKYEELLQGRTQCNSCQGASDNAIFPAIETAYTYYGASPLQALCDREAPYALVSPDNTFLGFTSFTAPSVGRDRAATRYAKDSDS